MTTPQAEPQAPLARFAATERGMWSSKENRWAILISIACAYLSLFNLGYAPLWDDEPHMASIARNILDSGEYTTWDGRNLMGTNNGRAVNEGLVAISYPPLQAMTTLLGITLFGYNEIGVRFFHALLGVASLFVFWQLLRLDFASRPRLRVIAFALFALSAQSILFFRQGRYAADAIFFSLALIYAYRLYIGPSGKPWHLACATFFAVLGFFNQFFIGVTTLLALATWHMMFHWRATTRRQYLSFAVAGAIFSLLSIGYLWTAGIFEGRASLNLGGQEYQHSWPARGFVIAYLNFRDIVRFNWMPMYIAIWLLGWVSWLTLSRLRDSATKRKPEDTALARYLVFFVLLLLFVAFVSIQSTSVYPFANTRYLAAALPFSFLLIAACVDWVWHRMGKAPALSLLAVLMISNLAGQPASFKQIQFTLPSLINEIHQPLGNSMSEVSGYLQAHAKQDELIQVEPWTQRDVLMFYLGDKLLFCCMLNKETTPLPPETVLSMSKRLYLGEASPDWVVGFSPLLVDPEIYELAFASQTHHYSSWHRPEIEQRAFSPMPGKGNNRAFVYRRKAGL